MQFEGEGTYLGFAKKVFSETYERRPWFPPSESKQHLFPWPLLNGFLKENRLAYLDYILIHRLLRHDLEMKEEGALFLCHLILAGKQGHLCVCLEKGELKPSVKELWRNEEERSFTNEEADMLTQLIKDGINDIPKHLLTTINGQEKQLPWTPFCRQGEEVYFQRYWMLETLFIHDFFRHIQTSPSLKIDEEKMERMVNQLVDEKLLIKEQAEAILQGCNQSLTVVVGGPGTGKTYTAGYLIKVFWQHLSEEEKSRFQIVLAAPTGKAAANLQQSLGKIVGSFTHFSLLEAKTLHALLNIRPFSYKIENQYLSADLIIVDESSMIDIRLMATLFASLKPGSRVILLGDPYQLPSVEAGSVFLDLVQSKIHHPSLSFACPHLKTCLRVELHSLIDFAQRIHQRQGQEVLRILNDSKEKQGVKRLTFSTEKKEAYQELIEYVSKDFPAVVKSGQSPEQFLELFQKFRLLSPIRNGVFGVEALNQSIWRLICQNLPHTGWCAIPILIVVNDYQQELFNGETGILIRRLPLEQSSSEDYALFPSRMGEGKLRRFSFLLLPKHEYAYCLSVHKSQGSEFDRVIFILPEGSELFGCEVFYTAVTRARKQIEIYGSDSTILKTVSQQGTRLSGIIKRLQELSTV